MEIGFGPGVGIQQAAKIAEEGFVAGVDPSKPMLNQASKRNRPLVQQGRVELRRGVVSNIPYDDNTFDKAFSVNSLPFWTDARVGLREIQRVVKPGGLLALGVTPHAKQPNEDPKILLRKNGFHQIHTLDDESTACIIGQVPKL